MDLPENTVHVWGVPFEKRNHSREIAHAILSKYLPPQPIQTSSVQPTTPATSS